MEKITLTKTEIYKNFAQRLLTQDRFYASICYPISLLKRVFAEHNESDFMAQLIDSQIDRIIAYTGDDKKEFVKISQVEGLTINTNGTVNLQLENGEICQLYSFDSKEKNLKLVFVEKLGNIHIDHVTPMSKVLKKLEKELPMLQQLHNKLIFISNRQELQDWGEYLFDVKSTTVDDVNQLKNELTLIDKSIKVQLMYSKSNLSKSKK